MSITKKDDKKVVEKPKAKGFTPPAAPAAKTQQSDAKGKSFFTPKKK